MRFLHKLNGRKVLLSMLVFLAACDTQTIDPGLVTGKSKPADEYTSDMPRAWFVLLCKVVKNTDGYYPPMAARAFGYMGVTLYESVQPGIPGAKSLKTQLNGFTVSMPVPEEGKVYNWGVASNAALAQTMRNFFKNIKPKYQKSLDSLETYYHAVLTNNEQSETVNNSVAFGKSIANALYEHSKTDGGHEAYLNPTPAYNAPSGDAYWIETGSGKAVGPNWGKNRLFLAINAGPDVPPPVTFSTDPNSAMYQQAYEVYNQSKINTADQDEIARFWADDPFLTCTPTGHTFSILTQLLGEVRASLAKAAVAYAKMGIAEHDAFICCWRAKYQYSLVRPVTYIQKFIDPNWHTLIDTPPFPAYVSGHSTEIGSASRIFTATFGANYAFTDKTQVEFGFARVLRSYTSFEQVAQESAWSRLYGGLHYRMDIVNGLDMGKAIGDNVNTISMPSVPF